MSNDKSEAAAKPEAADSAEKAPSNFIRTIVIDDLKSGRHTSITTRFPPEPNGYLHIGHCKAICLNFGLAAEFDGKCNLRFDDTNPIKEDVEYVNAIQNDIKWLGWDWDDRLFFASDYFETLYGHAVHLIETGKAYVCDLSAEAVRKYRGTLTEPGKPSPSRDRSVEENLTLFKEMRAGDFADGSRTLRAKIDMESPNLNMRDPTLYRIRRVHHHRTGDDWCIYPMYDFTHGLSDAEEHVTHSLCSLEFEDHRPLYDWFINSVDAPSKPRQIEFARLNLTYTMMSKRYLRKLVEDGVVAGWDDPRMPTVAGMRRRGYTAESIRDFCNRIGMAKANSMVDIAMLEHCLRNDLNTRADRVMAVLKPLKLVIANYPDDKEELLEAVNNPGDESAGTRMVPFSRELYIERSDFAEDPPRKWFRFTMGKEVRLKHAYYVTTTEVIKDDDGEVVELRCTYDPESRGGGTPDGRKVRGTSHWVSAKHAVGAEVRLYDHLFTDPDPAGVADVDSILNPASIEILSDCLVEPSLTQLKAGDSVQFMRQGYFVVDPDSTDERLVFNRTVSLRDSWARMQKRAQRK